MSGAFLGQVEIKSGQKMTAELGTKKKTGNSSKKNKHSGGNRAARTIEKRKCLGIDLRKF
jgi:hypothetical protein